MTESPARLRVLVVDDLAEMRALIRRALSVRGYVVDVASTLAEARELNPAGYAAVLIDAHLGPDQGIDLIAALQAEDPAAAKRCLLMTGGSAGAIPAGIPYLTKPFKLPELISAVQALHRAEAREIQAARAPRQARAGRVPGQRGDGQVPREARKRQPPDPQADAIPGLGVQPIDRADRAGGESQVWRLLQLIRLLRAREHVQLADFLHDGPMQELTAVSLEMHMMVRSAGSDVSAQCGLVLERLDAAARSLRWLVDRQWPFQVAETSLATAVEQRTSWLLPAPVTVAADSQEDALPAADVPAVVDIMELMALALAPASPQVRVTVAIRARDDLIDVDLALTPDPPDGQQMDAAGTAQAALALAALRRLAAILGATAQATLRESRWLGRITLPKASLQVTDQRQTDSA